MKYNDSTAANGDPIHNGDVMGIQGSSIDVVGHDVDDVTLSGADIRRYNGCIYSGTYI